MIELSTFLFIDLLNDLVTGIDLFIIGSIIILVKYLQYLEIPKNKKVNLKRLNLDLPIYQSKDILLQEKKLGLELIPLEKTTSIWVKAIVFILIFLVTVTPLYQLLGTDYFL